MEEDMRRWRRRRGGGGAAQGAAGTPQFTCFTSTKVQILTPEVLQSAALGERRLDELTQLLADAEKKRFQK
jgi:hypothetical protein